MARFEFSVHPDLRNSRIELHVPDQLPHTLFNLLEIRRVVLNLVINSAHASKAEDVITITVEADDDWIQFRVKDQGKGLPVDIRHRIFYSQVTTKPEGTGLGLLACRQIIERHGGRMEYKPDASARGSVFAFCLPAQTR
jgi:signal transduction histidine kinase